MSLNNLLPKEYSPKVLAGLEAAFNEVWGVLHANVPRANEEANQELAIALSQTLGALCDGVTDPKAAANTSAREYGAVTSIAVKSEGQVSKSASPSKSASRWRKPPPAQEPGVGRV